MTTLAYDKPTGLWVVWLDNDDCYTFDQLHEAEEFVDRHDVTPRTPKRSIIRRLLCWLGFHGGDHD